jgi:hypothetical protein
MMTKRRLLRFPPSRFLQTGRGNVKQQQHNRSNSYSAN